MTALDWWLLAIAVAGIARVHYERRQDRLRDAERYAMGQFGKREG